MEIRYYSYDIRKFILSLDKRSSSDLNKLISFLSVCGNEIQMPYSKPLGNGLFELRKIGKRQFRVIYCFHKNNAVLLHIFEKKTNKISKTHLDIAKSRKDTLA